MKSLTDQDYSKVMSNRMEHSIERGNSSMRPNGCCSFPSNEKRENGTSP